MTNVGSLLILALGAGLLAAGERLSVAPAVWIALALMVHASRSLPIVAGAGCVWLSLFTALAISEHRIIPLSGPPYFAIVSFIATATTLPFVADRLAAPNLGPLVSTLVFPMAWVASEFLQSRFTAAATWGSVAYTQYGNLPLMQTASVVGIWGISFLIAWFASTFEVGWRHGLTWSAAGTPILTYAAVTGAVVVAGAARVALAPTDRPSMRVATLNRPVDLFVPGEMTRIAEGSVGADERARLGEKLARLHDWFLEGSRREARAGARVVVWPETSLLIFKEDEKAFLDRARRLASDEHVVLAMGMGTVQPGALFPLENKLVLIDRDGETRMSYLKSHAVAGWEAGIMRLGDGRLRVVETPQGRIAGAICYDADFPEFVRQATQASADVLIVPANDWKEVKEMHAHMHAFRAVETGLPVVRAAASGLSSAFDPWGRVLGVADFFASGDRTLTAQVPVGGVPTIYARTGDLFAWLCVAALVCAMIVAR